MGNPFTPSFGAPPPALVGRADLVADFGDTLDDGPGVPVARRSAPGRVESVKRSCSTNPKPKPAAGLARRIRDCHARVGRPELTDALAEHETGLVITVDEIHRKLADDLRALGAIVQHAFREERELAFAAAGLPASISDLLGDDVLTFLRRADRHSLRAVPLDEVARAIREPIEGTGRAIADADCRTAAEATNG